MLHLKLPKHAETDEYQDEHSDHAIEYIYWEESWNEKPKTYKK